MFLCKTLLVFLLQCFSLQICYSNSPRMKVAIIGAGGAGLAAAKYALEEGFECDVFEQTGVVGGTWNYVDETGTDENGLPIHSAMYKGLRTNLPKEVMAYMDFPYPDKNQSFVTQPDVLKYLQSYSQKFNLDSVIRYYKHIVKVDVDDHEKWHVTIRDAKTKKEETKKYDAVMVCNGHYSEPKLPNIPGSNKFKGRILHSHDYRSPDSFANKTVVVVGTGPSGIDIADQVSKLAKQVFLSHRSGTIFAKFEDNVIKKGVLEEIFENSVLFKNDTAKENVDVILYCTGYKYSFPFLTEKCNIKVLNNQVYPVYKQMINIEHPTMAFVGLVFQVTPFPLFDIQTRFFLATLKNSSTLPTKFGMRQDLENETLKREKRGYRKDQAHKLGEYQEEYCNDLADLAKIRRLPPVIHKIFVKVRNTKPRNLDQKFKIIDDENFLMFE